MADKEVRIKVSSDSEPLINDIKRSEAAMGQFSNKVMGVMSRAGQAINGLSQKYMNGLTMLTGGAGMVLITKNLMEFEDGLIEFGRVGGYTRTQVAGLREQILNMISPQAKEKLGATKDEIMAVANALNNTGIGIDNIQRLLPQMVKGAIASKTDFSLYGETVGDFVDKYKVKIEDLGGVQDALNETLKLPDIRGHANEYLQSLNMMLRTTANLGIHGKDDVKALLAMQGVLASVSGSAQTANSEFQEMVLGMYQFGRMAISSRQSVQSQIARQFKGVGINFFDTKGNLLPMPQLIAALKKAKEVANKYHLDLSNIFTKAFTGTAGLALAQLAEHIDDVDGAIKKYNDSTGSVGKDFTSRQAEMSRKLAEFKTQLDSFEVNHMQGVLDLLSKTLSELEAHPIIAKSLLTGGAVMAGGMVASKVIGAGKDLFGFGKDIVGIFRGKKGGVLGKLEGTMAGATPVYVVNMGGMSGSIGNLTTAAENIAGSSRSLSMLGKAGMVGGWAATGYALGTEANMILSHYFGGKYSGQSGWMYNRLADWWNKDKINKENEEAANGSGALFSEILNKRREEDIRRSASEKNIINLTVHIDSQGRIIADSNALDTKLNTIAHGNFFPLGGASGGW